MKQEHTPSQRRLLFAVICIIFASSAGCSILNLGYRSVPHRVKIPSGDVQLPVNWWCDFAMVQVFIEQRGPFNFLLDTGASESIVTPEVAALFPKQRFRIRRHVRGSSGRRVSVNNALSVHLLEAGTARFHNFDALIMDLSVISDAMGTVVDGILGCPLFQGSLLRIDFPNHEVRVQQGTLVGPKRTDQFRVSGARRPYVSVTLGEKTYPVLVDTGSNSGLSLKKNVFQKQLYWSKPVVVSSTVGVSGKHQPQRAARITGMAKIGPHILNEPIVQSAGHSSVLGVEILRYFVVTYDRKNALVRLERKEEDALTMESWKSFGVGFRQQTDRWTIWLIFPFAEIALRELRIGDIVTRIAGRPVAEFDCVSLKNLKATRDAIEIEIERDAKTFTVTLPVVEVVP